MTTKTIAECELKSAALRTASELLSELEANPFCIAKIARLGQCYLHSGQMDKAVGIYEKFVKFDCTNYKAAICLGILRLLEAKYQQSYEILAQASKNPLAKKEFSLWLGLGAILLKFDKLDQAEAAYQLVISLNPSKFAKQEAFTKLGIVALRKKSYDKAMNYFKNALIGDSVRPDLLLFTGTCYELKGKLPEAIGLYTSASSLLRDQSFKAMQHLGWAQFLTGDYAQAEVTLTQALNLAMEQKAETADLHFLLGRVAQTLGNLDKAEKAFGAALTLDPDNSLFLLAIGILSVYQKRMQQAQEYFVKSTNVPYRGPEAWINLGNMYSICNQKDSAIHSFKKALEVDPTSPIAANRLKEVEEGLPQTNINFMLPPVHISDVRFSQQMVLKFNESVRHPEFKSPPNKGRGKVARREDSMSGGAPPAANVLSHLKGFLKNPMEMSRSVAQPSILSTASTTPRMVKTEDNPIFIPIMTSFISRLQDSLNPKAVRGVVVVDQTQKKSRI